LASDQSFARLSSASTSPQSPRARRARNAEIGSPDFSNAANAPGVATIWPNSTLNGPRLVSLIVVILRFAGVLVCDLAERLQGVVIAVLGPDQGRLSLASR
jgi:hypothetical protein